MRAHEMLSKIRWHPDYDESLYIIVYLHRGAPNDERSARMQDVEEYGTSDFTVLRKDGLESYIPYHRILRIEDGDKNVVWEKRSPTPKT